MAHVLTVGERQLLADHLRAGGRVAGFWAAAHVAAFGIGSAIGVAFGAAYNHRSRRRPR